MLENCAWQQLFEPNFEARAAPRTKPEQSGGIGLSEIGDQGAMAPTYLDISVDAIIGADYDHHITTYPPDFKNFLRPRVMQEH